MGGRLALYLTIFYPAYFTKVVLESASPGLKTEPERKNRREKDHQLALQLEQTDFEAFLNKWYNLPLFQTLKSHPRFEEMIKRRQMNQPHLLAKSLREMGTGEQPLLWEKVKQNKIPLLLVVGEKDAKFRAIANEMVETCPAAQRSIIPGCGHNTHFENTDEFVKCCFGFFRQDLPGKQDSQNYT